MLVKSGGRTGNSTNLIIACVAVAVTCLLVIGGSAAYIVYNLPSNQQQAFDASKMPQPPIPPGGSGQGQPPGQQGPGPQVGQPAPEIDGEDIDGVKFKLSDYRGKIVVVDFWGDW